MAEKNGWDQKQAAKRGSSPSEHRQVDEVDRDSASRRADDSFSDSMAGQRGIEEKGIDAPARQLDDAEDEETPAKPLTDNG